MNKKLVLTIGRQYGSGGRDIGKALAKKIGFPYYDKDLIASVVKKNHPEHLSEQADEQSMNLLLYSLSMSGYIFNDNITNNPDIFISDRLFEMQSNVIRDAADNGPCIIIGRCADYILSSSDYQCLSIFIHGDFYSRANRISEFFGLTYQQAKEEVEKIDKERSNYYNYFTGKKWGDLSNYHLTLNSSSLGFDGCLQILENMIKNYNAN